MRFLSTRTTSMGRPFFSASFLASSKSAALTRPGSTTALRSWSAVMNMEASFAALQMADVYLLHLLDDLVDGNVGLHEEVDRPKPPGAGDVLLLAQVREDHDGNALGLRIGLELGQKIEAGHLRKDEVEEHDVRRLGQDELQTLLRVGCRAHVEALLDELGHQDLLEELVVLHEHHFQLRAARGGLRIRHKEGVCPPDRPAKLCGAVREAERHALAFPRSFSSFPSTFRTSSTICTGVRFALVRNAAAPSAMPRFTS